MLIDVHVHISDARQWLLSLKSALAEDGHIVRFRIFGTERGRDAATSTLKLLEIAAFGPGRRLWARGNLDAITPQSDDDKADHIVSLLPEGGEDPRFINVFLDGKPGIATAVPSLLAKRVPYIEFRSGRGTLLAAGLPAIESLDIIVKTLDEFYTRVITLVRMSLRSAHPDGKGAMGNMPSLGADGEPHVFGFAGLLTRLWKRVMRQNRPDEHWRVGIRPRLPAPPIEGDTLIEGFRWLEDDGKRYYADPILFTHEGRDFLFVEEFEYATQRGTISVAELMPDGSTRAAPQRIIESSGHLSYPFLFRHADAIWMIPENSAERRLPLYRAERFPDRWVHAGDLLTGIGVHDATLIDHAGSWWLLGNTEEDSGSSWDCLSIFHAPSPLGPFQRVGPGPVLVDARYSRSAGPVIKHAGRLVRPVQSCLGHYGRFIRFLEIDMLSENQFRQTERGRLLAPLGPGVRCVHTYSHNERFEAVDALGL